MKTTVRLYKEAFTKEFKSAKEADEFREELTQILNNEQFFVTVEVETSKSVSFISTYEDGINKLEEQEGEE